MALISKQSTVGDAGQPVYDFMHNRTSATLDN